MKPECIKYEVKDGIATLTLNRPEKRNALNLRVFQEMSACLDKANEDKTVAAVILTGGEKVFSAGMDIEEMTKLAGDDIYEFWNSGYNLAFEKLYSFRVPTIAAVSGYALAGGFDLSISCDFRIASETARFGQLEVNLNLSPGIDRLWRLVGLSRAKYLGLTGDIIDAEEAYRIGLADKVVSVENLMTEARELAAKFASKPRQTLEMSKLSYTVVPEMGHKAAINWETMLLTRLFDTEERKMLMERFIKK